MRVKATREAASWESEGNDVVIQIRKSSCSDFRLSWKADAICTSFRIYLEAYTIYFIINKMVDGVVAILFARLICVEDVD
jgi:hypothetical protein